jgi:hypothetical protein
MGLLEMNSEKAAQLIIVPIYKKSYIRKIDDWGKIPLQYSSDIKVLELQVLLHGYKILENTSDVYNSGSGFQLRKYELKQIS